MWIHRNGTAPFLLPRRLSSIPQELPPPDTARRRSFAAIPVESEPGPSQLCFCHLHLSPRSLVRGRRRAEAPPPPARTAAPPGCAGCRGAAAAAGGAGVGGQGKGFPPPALCPFYQEREQVPAHPPELLLNLSAGSQSSSTFSYLRSHSGVELKAFSHARKWLLRASKMAVHFCTCESLDTVLPPFLIIPTFTKNFPGTWVLPF